MNVDVWDELVSRLSIIDGDMRPLRIHLHPDLLVKFLDLGEQLNHFSLRNLSKPFVVAFRQE